ncbi:hypothetical protein RJT34_25735 [Clitoria ternatea]|uniref:Uncharacterized protein n=1 Tax=Clitoria ternatea TaxID=43366 RepID=A0AAN9FYA4_CLITE
MSPTLPSPHADSPSHIDIASPPSEIQSHSPSHLASDSPTKVPKPPAVETTHPTSPLFASEQEKEKMVLSEPIHEEPELKEKSPLKTIPKSPERMSTQPAEYEHVSSIPSSSPVFKTELATHHPSSPLASEPLSEKSKPKTEETVPQKEEKMEMVVPHEAEPKIKSPKSPLKNNLKSPETSSQPENQSTQSKTLHPEEKEKVVPETTKARKGKETTTGQPRRSTTASSSGTTKAKDSFAKAFRGDKNHHGAPQETMERKVMFATSNPTGKNTRVVSSSDQGTRNVSSMSYHEASHDSSSGGQKAPLQKGIKDDITKFVHKLTTSVHTPQPNDHDKQFSVITLAGDNRGATMHVGSDSAKKEGSIHIHRAYKSDQEESTEVTTDGEDGTEEDNQEESDDDEVGMAYVNSNIQSINNSLMFHGSISERDPGVQLSLPQQAVEPIKPIDRPGLETQRTHFNINRAEKSTYQPMVRRRSPRGLFLEPNHTDNLDKPRPHGCKLSCDKDIEDIDIL